MQGFPAFRLVQKNVGCVGRRGLVGKDPTLGPAVVGSDRVDAGLHLLLAKGLLDQLADGGGVAGRECQQGWPRAAQTDSQ